MKKIQRNPNDIIYRGFLEEDIQNEKFDTMNIELFFKDYFFLG